MKYAETCMFQVKCSISSRDVLPHMHRTVSPVSETQDYDYLHHVKGAVKSWSFRDDMCRIESQKYIKINVYRLS